MPEVINFARRKFVKKSLCAGGGLLLGVHGEGSLASISPKMVSKFFSPSAWLNIDVSGKIHIQITRSEMGQGVNTSLPMIVVEELDADFNDVVIHQAPASGLFGSMATGGSKSIRDLWSPLRKAGAVARQMLVTVAAEKFGVPVSELTTKSSQVIHVNTGRIVDYSELTEAASKLSLPETIHYKSPEDFSLIGKATKRLDTAKKVTGKINYGIDISIPGMLNATVIQAPVFGASVKSFDAHHALDIPGVKKVFQLKPDVIAVVADTFWQTQKAAKQIKIEWDLPEQLVDDEYIRKTYSELSEKGGEIYRQKSDSSSMAPGKYQWLESKYECGFQAHLTMEPMNCTAHVHADGCDVWAPTQHPQYARSVAVKHGLSTINKYKYKILGKLGIDADLVKINVTPIGCGFGRRLEVDFIEQAVLISKEVMKPVKLVWSREEDVQHDFYRPYTFHSLKAGYDVDNKKISWNHHVVGPEFGKTMGGIKPSLYEFTEFEIKNSIQDVGIPYGPWRSVGSSHNGFVLESMVDELSNLANIDPYEFRLKYLSNSRAKKLIKRVAELASWENATDGNRGLGMAVYAGYDSLIAMVSEVSINSGEISVDKIYAAVDCGIVINPATVKSQVEGGVAFALTAALKSGINIEAGRVKQSNFHDIPVIRCEDMPAVEVAIISDSELQKPGGVGELAVPVVAPSVMNAVFAVTGKRIRRIPLTQGAI